MAQWLRGLLYKHEDPNYVENQIDYCTSVVLWEAVIELLGLAGW